MNPILLLRKRVNGKVLGSSVASGEKNAYAAFGRTI
jgi:hypothetical protein